MYSNIATGYLLSPILIHVCITVIPFLYVFVQIKFFGDDMSPLYEEIDPELLPEELGGSQPPFNSEHTIAFVEGTATGTEV